MPRSAERPTRKDFLREDYVYFFERYFEFLNSLKNKHIGYIFLDEIDKKASNILLEQISKYFQKTEKGKQRAELIIPEVSFVHSDLTTMIQIADLIAYVISWGWGHKGLGIKEPRREELKKLSTLISEIQFKGCSNGHQIYGYKIINELE